MILIGYIRSFALRGLVTFYERTPKFNQDIAQLRSLMPLIDFLPDDTPTPILAWPPQDAYIKITDTWKRIWANAQTRLSPALLAEVQSYAEKWGLRCSWGCGFILNKVLSNIPISFFMAIEPVPSPEEFKADQSLHIDFFDNREGLKQKTKALLQKVTDDHRSWRDHARSEGFSLFIDDNFPWKVRWLFVRLTPPYPSFDEIAMADEKCPCDPETMRRGYQKIAKMLEIKIERGWPKGRQRRKGYYSEGYQGARREEVVHQLSADFSVIRAKWAGKMKSS